MRPLHFLCALSLTLPLFSSLQAQDLPAPPRLPTTQESGQVIEPDITIRETEQGTAYEYRANGHLYMVKIKPKVGKPYYELDTDGDGELDTRTNDFRESDVPMWVLLRF
jgi:hypothetical protein